MWPQIIAAVQKVFELGHMLVSDWSKRNLGGTNLMNTDQMLVTRRAVPGILEFVTTHPLCGGGGGSDADLLVVCVTRYHVGVVVDMVRSRTPAFTAFTLALACSAYCPLPGVWN